MRSPFETQVPKWHKQVRWAATAGSIGVYLLFINWAFEERPSYAQGDTWIEMTVIEEPPPPPPPEPEPEPEPEPPPPPELEPEPEPEVELPPPPEPEVVDFNEIEPPPEVKPPPRRIVQGLSASSFAAGSGTGVQVRAGTTVRARATDEIMELEEAPAIHYASVTDPPRLRGAPPTVNVPDEAIEAGIEGSWTVWVSIDATGKTVSAEVPETIGYGIDAACIQAWMRSRWRPGSKDNVPIGVNKIPMTCTIRALD